MSSKKSTEAAIAYLRLKILDEKLVQGEKLEMFVFASIPQQ